MSYLAPLSQRPVLARTRLRGIGQISEGGIERNRIGIFRRIPNIPPLPVPPMRFIGGPNGPLFPPDKTAPTTPAGVPSGYCIFTSSPETGGVVSIAQCSAGQGGVPIAAPNPAPAATPTVASPVPSTWPTNQPYTDSNGNIWTYSAGGWQITGNLSSVMPGPSPSPATSNAPAGGSPVNVNTGGNSYDSIINWLNSQSLISGVANFWIVGGGALIFMLLRNRGARR